MTELPGVKDSPDAMGADTMSPTKVEGNVH